jgi:glycosyltransferase involved in cell wall biosynthesis
MKILHIISSAGVAGGERYLLDLVRFSTKNLNHKIVLPHRGPFEERLNQFHIDYAVINLNSRFSLHSIFQLVRLIKAEGIDLVHTHGFRADFYGRVAGILSSVRQISTIHVSLFDYLDTPVLIRWLYILIDKALSFKTTKFLCISNAMREDIRKLGVKDHKIELIHNGVDAAHFYPRNSEGKIQDLGILTNGPIIGTVGRMVPEKGHVHLIKALQRLKPEWENIRCIFVGDGPMLSQLKQMAFNLGVADNCIFCGIRPDVESIYSVFDVFVLPSLREPFGLALLEAMISRVPVVATDAGGPRDFIKTGVNGVLVPPKDDRALARRISYLLKNKQHADALAKMGRETALDHFNIEGTVKKIESVYFSTVG